MKDHSKPEPDQTKSETTIYQRLLNEEITVVNVGLEGFATDLQHAGINVVHVDWSPPAGGDPDMAALLAKLGV